MSTGVPVGVIVREVGAREAGVTPTHQPLPLVPVHFSQLAEVLGLAPLPRAAAVPVLDALDGELLAASEMLGRDWLHQRQRRKLAQRIAVTGPASGHRLSHLAGDPVAVDVLHAGPPLAAAVLLLGPETVQHSGSRDLVVQRQQGGHVAFRNHSPPHTCSPCSSGYVSITHWQPGVRCFIQAR